MPSVKKLPVYPDDSGWFNSLPRRNPNRPLQTNLKVDALILGAGFAGLSAAHRLAKLKPEWSIGLVDAMDIGMASSGRNSGFMIDLPHTLDSDSYSREQNFDRQVIAFNRSAIDYSRSLIKRYRIACDWSETGKIHGAASAQGAQSHGQFMRALDSLDEAYKPLDKQQMQAITGIDYYHSGLHTPGSASIQPVAFVRGLADNLPDNVALYENTPITQYAWGTPHHLVTPNGHIQAHHVLICNNGFGAMFGLGKHNLLPLLLFASMTSPMTAIQQQQLGGHKQWGLVPSHPAGATIKRTGDQRILVRTGIRSGYRMAYTPAVIEKMKNMHQISYQKRFGRFLPDLAFAHTWGGLLCMSRNEGSIFGTVGKRLYAAICQNGLGVARGMASGKLLGEYVADQDSELLRQRLCATKPAYMPPHPISTLGVMGNIWRHEKQAGEEA